MHCKMYMCAMYLFTQYDSGVLWDVQIPSSYYVSAIITPYECTSPLYCVSYSSVFLGCARTHVAVLMYVVFVAVIDCRVAFLHEHMNTQHLQHIEGRYIMSTWLRFLSFQVGGGKPKMRYYFGANGWPKSSLGGPPETDADKDLLIDSLQARAWRLRSFF